jgi:RNA polymerase sigma-70 factor, ECF subfamily
MSDDSFLAGRAAAANEALDRALRDEPGGVLSVLARSLGDIDLAEEALQDAAAAALARWPVDGVPANPGGWLVTVGRRRAIDRLRRTTVGRRKEAASAAALARAGGGPHGQEPGDLGAAPEDEPLGDERLALMFACCHPALALPSRVALTLRTLGGLSTAEIARAFVVAEPAMKQRITRAKQRIRTAGIPLRVPPPGLLDERLPGVLAVLYLVFNEGYASTGSAGRGLTRPDLSEEAVRLARLVDAALPTPETRALVALMLFHHARVAAREAPDGALVPLGEQDRTRWNGAAITEANRLLAGAAAAAGEDPPGPYQLQAAIASVHANAARPEDTRWDDIARLYDGLVVVAPTSVFRLNRAVAYSMTAGPQVALAQVDAVTGLDAFHLFHATRADLLRRLGRPAEAEAAYRTALTLTTNEAERHHLERRIAECGHDRPGSDDAAGYLT